MTYDLFIYSEDDICVTPTTVASSYWIETKRIESLLQQQQQQQSSSLSSKKYLPSDFHVGLVRYVACFLVDCFQTGDVQDKIGNLTAEDDKNCLLLWQGSLWLHTMSQSIKGQNKDENAIWHSLTATMSEVRNAIQSSIPMTLLLASVSRLLEDDARSSLLSQALPLVDECVVDVHPDSAEASIFLGLLPDLCEAIGGHDVRSNSATASYQAALLAAEHIGSRWLPRQSLESLVFGLYPVFPKLSHSSLVPCFWQMMK